MAAVALETLTSELQVRLLHPAAVPPRRAHEHDAGLDLACVEDFTLWPARRRVVGTGVAIALPPGMAGLVVPRSGLAARHGITIVNAPGLIDSGYRGELMVILQNTDLQEPFVVEPGMRIAQLVVVPVPTLEAVEVEELPETERGDRGHGSSSE
jgi:dUTP pyrophosphatase